jgi:hypothetical protein
MLKSPAETLKLGSYNVKEEHIFFKSGQPPFSLKDLKFGADFAHFICWSFLSHQLKTGPLKMFVFVGEMVVSSVLTRS